MWSLIIFFCLSVYTASLICQFVHGRSSKLPRCLTGPNLPHHQNSVTVTGGLLIQTHSSPIQIVVFCLFNVIMVKQKGGLLIALSNNVICCNHIMFQPAKQNSIMIWHIDGFNKIKYSGIIVERFDEGILDRYADI